jgi:parallel beta-helix repeat protein
MKTQSLYQARVPRQRIRFSLVFVAVISLPLLLMRPGNAYALSCGDTISINTTLGGNLGPCGGVALTVGANSITLHLNGFKIFGLPGFEGVNVGGTTNVAIKGPGTITGFTYGVSVFDANGNRTASNGTKVSHVHFVANSSIGIVFVGGTGNQIVNNTFINNPCSAIKVDAVSNALIVGNAITRSNAPTTGNNCGMQQYPTGGGLGIAVVSSSPGAIVKANSVNHSTYGIYVDMFASPVTVTSNDFSGNTQDGIDVLSQATMESNKANGNGGNGITLANASGSLVRFNTANSNRLNGIGLGNLLGSTSGNNNTIKFNRALGNATDLFWDQGGTGNCWKGNIFDTSMPSALPSCP